MLGFLKIRAINTASQTTNLLIHSIQGYHRKKSNILKTSENSNTKKQPKYKLTETKDIIVMEKDNRMLNLFSKKIQKL